MDPDVILAEIRDQIRVYLAEANGDTEVDRDFDLDHLTDMVEALDEWLRRGGALPTEWQR